MAKKGREVKGAQYKPKDGGRGSGPPVKPKPKSRRARRIVEAREPKLVSGYAAAACTLVSLQHAHRHHHEDLQLHARALRRSVSALRHAVLVGWHVLLHINALARLDAGQSACLQAVCHCRLMWRTRWRH